MRLFLLAVFALLSACSPETRLKRLVKRYPELLADNMQLIRTVDTVTIQGDTIYRQFYFRPGESARDTFVIRSLNTTTIIERDGNRLSVAQQTPTRDTIITKDRTAPVAVVRPDPWYYRLAWPVFAATLIFLLLIKKPRKTEA